MKSIAKRFIPRPFWNLLGQVYTSSLQKSMSFLGYNIARKKDYYSPLPSVSELRASENRWNKPSQLAAVDYDLDAFKSRLDHLTSHYYEEFTQHPAYEQIMQRKLGEGYTPIDGLMLYMMVRDTKPKRYLEVGSGESTLFCHLATEQNKKEGHPVQIRCIEPFPYENLYTIPDIKVDAKIVQDVDLPVFQELEENDILLIDSSHVLRLDGDVAFLYLEVLPNLKKGVIVHIHDMPFPYNIPYPPEVWLYKERWPKFWTEAMMVQAFLCYNNAFELLMSTPLIRYHDLDYFKQKLPMYDPVNSNIDSALWLKKVV